MFRSRQSLQKYSHEFSEPTSARTSPLQYSPLSTVNKTVETVCKEVLQAGRALLSELRMSEKKWPAVLPLLPNILNHSVRPSLGNRAPITALAGLPAEHLLRTLIPANAVQLASLDFVQAQRIVSIKTACKAQEKTHRAIARRKNKKRDEAVRRHNELTHVRSVNCCTGHSVLVAKRTSQNGHKLRVSWNCPRRITRAVSELVFECEDLFNGSHALFHSNKLKLYADSQLDVSERLLDTLNHNGPHLNTVEQLLFLRYNNDTAQYGLLAK